MGKQFNVINNGVSIPNKCTCMWCGGEMERRGITYMGAGTNTFALWCDNCGAVVIHSRNFDKKIRGFEIKWEYEEEKL